MLEVFLQRKALLFDFAGFAAVQAVLLPLVFASLVRLVFLSSFLLVFEPQLSWVSLAAVAAMQKFLSLVLDYTLSSTCFGSSCFTSSSFDDPPTLRSTLENI